MQLGFREAPANKQTIYHGQMGIIESIKRNQFSTGFGKCLEIVLIIKTKGSIPCYGDAYTGLRSG